jgi:protein-tyrosine-phosphatase
LILVMEAMQVVHLNRVSAVARSKTFLLGHFASRATTDIRDPFGGTPEDFSGCYALINDACSGLLAEIAGQALRPVESYGR